MAASKYANSSSATVPAIPFPMSFLYSLPHASAYSAASAKKPATNPTKIASLMRLAFLPRNAS
jgi:hypothetical protein